MKKIRGKVWSRNIIGDSHRFYVDEIRRTPAQEVDSFSDLVKELAYISYQNPMHSLYYRGQARDYTTPDGLTSLNPSIYRNLPSRSRSSNLRQRIEKLEQAEKLLVSQFKNKRYMGRLKLEKFRETRWALLQHYQVCDTPLIDVTASLRVACSFALNSDRDHSYVFVLGVPHVNGAYRIL